MQEELNKIAKDTNIFLKEFIKKQKKIKINLSNAVWFVFRRKENKIKSIN